MFPKSSTDAKYAVMGGAVAGIAAGALLTATMTVMSAVTGHDIWSEMKGAAAPILGAEAIGPGFSFLPVMVGLASHLLVSMLWGIGFGFLAYHLDRRTTLVAGGLYGVLAWLGISYLVLPAVGLSAIVSEAPTLRSVVYHVFFGLSMAVALLAFEIEEDHDRNLAFRFRHSHG